MNPQRAKRPKRISAADKARAADVLRPAMDDLKALMEQAKQMIGAEARLKDVLDVLEGIGRAATRMANLLQAEQELGAGDDLGDEIDQAIAEMLGQRPLFKTEGYGGAGGTEKPPSACPRPAGSTPASGVRHREFPNGALDQCAHFYSFLMRQAPGRPDCRPGKPFFYHLYDRTKPFP